MPAVITKTKDLARFGGFAAVFFQIMTACYILLSGFRLFEVEYTFSSVATIEQLRPVFVTFLCLSAVSFWLFMYVAFSKKHSVPMSVASFSMASFIALVTIPYDLDSNTSVIVHKAIGLITYVSFLYGVYYIARQNRESELLSRVSFYSFYANLALFPFFVLIDTESMLFLVWEVIVVLINQLWILSISWINIRNLK